MCRTLKAQYCKVSGANFIRQNTMGATAILEIEMEEPKPIQVAQIYDREQNPMNGRVYSEDGIALTLRTPTGGLSEPKIMQICSYVPNSMCAGKIVDADGIATAVMENHGMPTAVVEPLSCAIRGRNPDCPSDRTAGINTEQRLEIGSDVANCVTTVQKDSMVIEPAILTPIRTEKAKELRRQGIETFANRELAGTIHTYSGSGGNTDQFVKEPISRKDNIAFKEMPDGNIHAFRANDPKKSTAPEWQITNADNVHPTITTSHEPKVLLKYRIRKLTERECFRLMGVDDADIDKIDAYRIKTTLKNGTVKEKPIPKSQKYKMAGNSICISPLYYLFKAMFIDDKPLHQARQLSLFD